MGDDKANESLIDHAVTQFVHSLEGLKTTEELVLPLLQALSNDVRTEFNDFCEKNGVRQEKDEDGTSFQIPFEANQGFHSHTKRRRLIVNAFH